MARVSLPRRHRALADLRTGAINRAVCASARVCEEAEISNLRLQSGERGEQIARLWLGIKSKQAKASNRKTGSVPCLCSPFLFRSCSPSGSSISISRVLSSRLQRELGFNQSNCQR